MRDPKRIKPFLAKLERLWRAQPNFRFAQIIAIATPPGDHPQHQPGYYLEDWAWEEEIDLTLGDCKSKSPQEPAIVSVSLTDDCGRRFTGKVSFHVESACELVAAMTPKGHTVYISGTKEAKG